MNPSRAFGVDRVERSPVAELLVFGGAVLTGLSLYAHLASRPCACLPLRPAAAFSLGLAVGAAAGLVLVVAGDGRPDEGRTG